MHKESQNTVFSHLPHILVVDDDNRIRSLIQRFLQENGFLPFGAADAQQASEMMKRFEFDALILDVMMPGKNGFEFLTDIRQFTQIPVIMLTALGEADDRIKGLERGADDYLSKPFEPRELLLRVKSVLKRMPNLKTPAKLFSMGKWVYDTAHDELKNGDEIVRLTSVEANLLRALTENIGEVMSREDLAEVCGLDAGERTIDVQVTRLRRKIEENSKTPRYLMTLRGKGYMLRADRIE